ncbi:hypothetical protein HAX54_046533, partial [Datura stramonium]|nr:hypothetical protein [Datura stramonium]
ARRSSCMHALPGARHQYFSAGAGARRQDFLAGTGVRRPNISARTHTTRQQVPCDRRREAASFQRHEVCNAALTRAKRQRLPMAKNWISHFNKEKEH